MRLPNVALVFAIIIIPIIVVFTMYVNYQVKTVNLKTTYDTNLVAATQDGISAFEMNTFGDSSSTSVTSTRRNVQASINVFTDAFASSYGLNGYAHKEVLTYVPAILFTMYDGYYIYSPTAENVNNDRNAGENYNPTGHVLQPYIYYSARYKGNNYDVVISYSLDNYITISGTIKGTYISKSGYLEDCDVSKKYRTSEKKPDNEIVIDRNGNYYKDGIKIEPENLYETLTLFAEDINLDGEIDSQDIKDIGNLNEELSFHIQNIINGAEERNAS